MGRSFASVRQQAMEITDRWARVSHQVPVPQMQCPARQIAGMAKNHSSEAFFGCDDPLESVLFSVFVGIRKLHDRGGDDVDP